MYGPYELSIEKYGNGTLSKYKIHPNNEIPKIIEIALVKNSNISNFDFSLNKIIKEILIKRKKASIRDAGFNSLTI